MNKNINSLAKKLIKESILSNKVLKQILYEADQQQLPLITLLLQKQLIDPKLLAKIIAEDFDLPFIDLNTIDKSQLPIHLIQEKLIRKHCLLPLLQKDKILYIAMANPIQQSVLDDIKFQTELNIQVVVVAKNQLEECIEKLALSQEAPFAYSNKSNKNKISMITEPALSNKLTVSEDSSVIDEVNTILLNAVQKHASDIHIEPYEKMLRIRFRIDGLLYLVKEICLQQANRIIARLKIMSQLDIAERRIPQDGRFKIVVESKKTVDCRLSTCPTIHGEKIAIRILNANQISLDIDQLGLNKAQKKIFSDALKNTQGLILVTGPTGSGKTVTLYTALNRLNTPTINISTVEDPVEIHLFGVNQVNINSKIGMNFPIALRAFLRQDPDLLMIGEMRDAETAEIGIKAAQTGHLVLSTLHTNSAAEALTRLINLGISHYSLATTVRLIIAQRLVRKLCQHCKQESNLPTHVLQQMGFASQKMHTLKIFEPKGCELCTEGYKGRIGLFELLWVNEFIAELIMRGEPASVVASQAKEAGMQTLMMSALTKIQEGITSFSEVHRII